MAKKTELPNWFPFAVVASAIVAIGAGIRSRGKTAASVTPAAAPPQQAGVLHEWLGGWVT